MSVFLGRNNDLEGVITVHLFGLCPNNSGSTFVNKAFSKCRMTWNIDDECTKVEGYIGPQLGVGTLSEAYRIWASRQEWIDALCKVDSYDWKANKLAWYQTAFARDSAANVFVTKAPPMLLYADRIVESFPNARFWIMVRNPYAVCEGIRRTLRHGRNSADPRLLEKAARHVIKCFEIQRNNCRNYSNRSVDFTYEEMCQFPEDVARRIARLIPEIDDLVFSECIQVRHYRSKLTNMNEQQISRLTSNEIAILNSIFERHEELLNYFGYRVIATH